MKSEFLAQMSHEIRTPLNTLINSSQFVREELTEERYEDQEEIFKIIQLSGGRIIRTVESLLSMSELQTGTYEPTVNQLNLVEDILEDLVKEYKLPAEEKNLELSLNVKTSAPTVDVDSYSVTEIFSHLIDNAIKYTNKGRVDVNVYDENNSIKVEVKDTGKGIREEFLPHLFESFRQEQQGYTRKYEGNGLGLALVNKFCEINKLKIDVESTVGKGTVFTVTFPV
ncbi:MAG: HAMP domain-containing sensor histidine kinase [Melioribacteraceae bacterium]|nr:HAMP domain-containing sensor histidine kinase [Melioribacteraceae bacterium]